MLAHQELWESHSPLISLDPTRKFGLAWHCIQNKYRELHVETKRQEDPLEGLPSKLVQLKLDTLEDSLLF